MDVRLDIRLESRVLRFVRTIAVDRALRNLGDVAQAGLEVIEMFADAAIRAEVCDEHGLRLPRANPGDALPPRLEVDVGRRRRRQREHLRREAQTRRVAGPYDAAPLVEVAHVMRRMAGRVADVEHAAAGDDSIALAKDVQI